MKKKRFEERFEELIPKPKKKKERLNLSLEPEVFKKINWLKEFEKNNFGHTFSSSAFFTVYLEDFYKYCFSNQDKLIENYNKLKGDNQKENE